MRYIILYIFFAFAGMTAVSYGQGLTLSDRTKVSLLTVAGGDQLYSLYGHTALRIHDPLNGLDDVYNFGYFDFRTPNFYLKFVKGDLQYFAAVDKYADFYNGYVYEQRGLFEQLLNLSQDQKQRIYDELVAILNSERRFYTYKFIDRNCTTMVADLINRNIQDSIVKDPGVTGQTYREILYDYQWPHFFENLGINIMFGSKTDKLFERNFLPLQLLEGVKNSKIDGRPLSNEVIVLNKESFKSTIPFWNSWITYVLAFALFVIFRAKRFVLLTYLILNALMGLFIFSAGQFSLHHELVSNINILLFNPLFLVLAIFIQLRKTKAVFYTVLVCAGMLAVYVVLLLNKPHFEMFTMMISVSGWMLYATGRMARKELKDGNE